MNLVRLGAHKLEWNINGVQIILMGGQKVHCVFVRFGNADTNIKSVHHRLVKVLLQGGGPKSGEVNTVKVLLKPKVGLCELWKKEKSENSEK